MMFISILVYELLAREDAGKQMVLYSSLGDELIYP